MDMAQRQQAGWLALEILLQDMHERGSYYTSAEIETEISAAQAEVKKARHDRRSH